MAHVGLNSPYAAARAARLHATEVQRASVEVAWDLASGDQDAPAKLACERYAEVIALPGSPYPERDALARAAHRPTKEQLADNLRRLEEQYAEYARRRAARGLS